ncbi:MAG: carboxylesterase [Rhodoferax sp.]|jgi:phospholipase/carboxylesterase|nr:carboxylesterase [Rhodoferax sp.]
MTTSCLPCIETSTGPIPTASIIWLHGLGASGDDFAAIVPELDLTACPPIRFVFPHAPSLPVTINGGYVMPAWYDIMGTPGQGLEDDTGIRHSAQAVEALIARELSRGIRAERIVLAGFSQGSAMVLHTGLRYAQRLAGIMALSGYLPLSGLLPGERSAANQDIPVFMAHGQSDPVVALARAEASRDQLTRLGYAVQWHTYPMPHSVHPAEIDDIGHFLRSVLAPESRWVQG